MKSPFKRFVLIYVASIIALFCACQQKTNQYSDWKSVGQGGGGILVDFVCHPTDSNIVWVVTDLTGIFRSTDGGVTYKRMSGSIEREELLYEWMRGMDHELVYDLSDPNIMYWAMDGGIYVEPGLYKSINGGDSWFKIPGSPDLSPGAIVVDYNGVIYGIKHKKMYVSTDKGATWQTCPDVPTYYADDDYIWRRRARIFIYTSRDNKIYIGDRREGTGIFYTSDMGKTWTQTLAGKEILDIGVSPTTPGLVMALEQDGRIFRSSDGGMEFEVVETVKNSYYNEWSKWPPYYGGITINRFDHVMAIGRWEMGVSEDGGLTFLLSDENEPIWDPADYPFEHRQTNASLFKLNKLTASAAPETWFSVCAIVKFTEDNGQSWVARSKGVEILCFYSPPVVDKKNSDIIHVAAGDNGHHYSTDLGQSWITTEIAMQNTDGLAQDPNNLNIWYKLYGGKQDQGSIHKSTDGGVTWAKLTNIPVPGFKTRTDQNPTFVEGWIGRIVVDPSNSNRIYATHRASDGLYRSEDGGKSFERVIELERTWELAVTKSGIVFVNTFDSEGLYKSTDNGDNFIKIHDGMVNNFVVHPKDENIIYMNVGSWSHAWASARVLTSYERNREHPSEGRGKLFKSIDGGKNWRLLGDYDGFALYIEPNYPKVMLMSTRDGGEGIMRSLDGGETWRTFHDAHDNYVPIGFVYGGVPGRVYSWGYHLLRRDNIHLDENLP